MATIGEQIIAARKAKGMTQDALSRAMNVSRSAVAHWEGDRRLPDAETLLKLSQVLEYSFEDEATKAPETAAQEFDNAQETKIGVGNAISYQSATPHNKRRLILCAVGAAAVIALCVCLFVVPKLTRKTNTEPSHDFNIATYQQETPNEAGKAWFSFDNREWEEKGDNETYQRYTFTMYEQNGVGFEITQIQLQADGGVSGVTRSATFGPGDLRADKLNPEIAPYGSFSFDGGFPVGQFLRVGVAIYGNDANGTPLVFYSLIEF